MVGSADLAEGGVLRAVAGPKVSRRRRPERVAGVWWLTSARPARQYHPTRVLVHLLMCAVVGVNPDRGRYYCHTPAGRRPGASNAHRWRRMQTVPVAAAPTSPQTTAGRPNAACPSPPASNKQFTAAASWPPLHHHTEMNNKYAAAPYCHRRRAPAHNNRDTHIYTHTCTRTYAHTHTHVSIQSFSRLFQVQCIVFCAFFNN